MFGLAGWLHIDSTSTEVDNREKSYNFPAPCKGGAGRGRAPGRGGAVKDSANRAAKNSENGVKRKKKSEDGEASGQDCEAGAGSSSSSSIEFDV